MAVYVELYFHAPNMSGKSTKYIENVLYELNILLKKAQSQILWDKGFLT